MEVQGKVGSVFNSPSPQTYLQVEGRRIFLTGLQVEGIDQLAPGDKIAILTGAPGTIAGELAQEGVRHVSSRR